MASIDIHCINGSCPSDGNPDVVSMTASFETRSDLVEHHFKCTKCKTTFVIVTEIMNVSVPKEVGT